jgi:rhamnogalacturonyl hydrolase YesR
MKPMTRSARILLIAVFVTARLAALASADTSKADILDAADKMADAQLHALGTKANTDWTWGVMEAGFCDYAHVSTRGDLYRQTLMAFADKNNWRLRQRPKNPFNPDDYCMGFTYLDLNGSDSNLDKLAPMTAQLNALVDHLNGYNAQTKLTFGWCDTLFMVPPVMARMSALTGDRKYIDAMNGEYWRAVDQQYDRTAHLFFRDTYFIAHTDANNKKIYWSRGNGWVLAGLAELLTYMPADYPSRSKYESLFKQLSATVAPLQGVDGLWRVSLADPDLYPGPESSGTALFTYAFAWGINHKLLPGETYLPVIDRAWQGLMSARRADNLPGFAQPEGDRPQPARRDSTTVFCTGACLLAASEVQKLAPLPAVSIPVLVDPPPVKAN